jgi:predicted membrane protein
MSRGISLWFAGTLSLAGLIFPFVLGAQPTGQNQSILLVMMLGIVGGFIHGAGFQPEQKWLRTLLSPAITWPVMLLSGGVLVVLRLS